MIFHEEQLKIIKDLIIQYQQTQNEKIFLQILKRMDKMLVETVMMFTKQYHIQAPMQDLYQTGVLGLVKAINKFKTNYKETAFPKCVLYWVRLELLTTYGAHRIDVEKYKSEHPETETPDINKGLIQEDIQRIIEEAIINNKLTEEDVCLLILIYIENMHISDIFRIFGNRWGKTYSTIQKRIEKLTRILKKEFIEHGFEE